jgi:hypothetical protein
MSHKRRIRCGRAAILLAAVAASRQAHAANIDGHVDLTDLSTILNNFGLTYANASGVAVAQTQTPTPEPTTRTLFTAGTILVLSASRRSNGKNRR